jgi:hypothetical protein
MAKPDYKVKYLDLRAKLLESTDVSYRLGYEDGLKEGQQAAQQQQMEQQMMEQQQAAAMGGAMPPGAEGGAPPPPGMEGEMPPEEMGAQMPQAGGEEDMGEAEGSELDQHIGELESMVQKGEKPLVSDLRKAVESLSTLRKSQKAKKSQKVQRVVSSQKSLVDNIMKKWENESKNVGENLESIIREHGIKIKG